MGATVYFDPTPGLRIERVRGGGRRGRPRVHAGGTYGFALSSLGRRRVGRVCGPSLRSWVHDVVMAAAGVGAPPLPRPGPLPPRRVAFAVTERERAAVDRAALDREFEAFARDAVMAAAGMFPGGWTPCADATLRKHYRRTDREALLRALPGRTSKAIGSRADRLGLALSLPDGYLTMAQAARKAGYHVATLWRMMDAAGVRPRRLAGRGSPQRFSHYFVTRAEFDRATSARLGTETVCAAAVRFRMHHMTLRAELRRRGVTLPAAGARMSSAVLDAAAGGVLAARGRGESVRAAAARVGVPPATLRGWMAAAGALPTLAARGTRAVGVDPAVVDRVVGQHRAPGQARRRKGKRAT